MSASVSGSMISLTRGDTLRLTIGIIQNGEPYEPNPGDIVRFALKKKIKDTEPIIYKVIPNDTLILEIEPTDTKSLDFGDYVYDIQLTTIDGDVDTFIGPSTFSITEEVC